MTTLWAIQTVAGTECLIETADGLATSRALRAIRGAVGFEYLFMAADGGTR